LRLEAPSLVEVNHRVGRSGRFEWVSLINLSGQLEKVLHEPLPVRDVTIELQPQGTVNAVRLLHAGTSLEFTREKGRLRCTVPELKSYEIVLFDE
jgi:hypothetical protein